jgi:hypothetical protein
VAVDRATLIAVFPEFALVAKYPEAAVDFWFTQADGVFPVERFGAQADLATMLYVAHNLTLGVLGAAGGGAGAFAPATSKSVDKVSKSMDPSLVMSAGAGIWNGTAYGQRLYALLRGFATGGFYRPSARAAALGSMRNYPYGRL